MDKGKSRPRDDKAIYHACRLRGASKENPEDLPGVLCKDFNVKATGAASWLSYEDAVNEATFKPEEVYNTYAIGGCDLSATTDLTCATLIIRRSSDDEIVYVFSTISSLKRKSTSSTSTTRKKRPIRFGRSGGS